MSLDDEKSRLSQLSTCWSLMFQAHAGPTEQMRLVRQQLLDRYRRPVERYLLASVGDPHAADELFQEFALRLVRGDFQRAHPDRGRFREFLKSSLYHLLVDHWRSQHNRPKSLEGVDSELAVNPPSFEQLDAEFITHWREQLMANAWESLAEIERRVGPPYHTVLKLRADEPNLTSSQMAQRLATQLGRPVDAAWVRKSLERARRAFSAQLVSDIAQGLDLADRESLHEELDALGLLEVCRAALAEWRS